MTANHTLTLRQRLDNMGYVTVEDLQQELLRVKQQRKAQEQKMTLMVCPVATPIRATSTMIGLWGRIDKAVALVAGIVSGVRMIKRIKALF